MKFQIAFEVTEHEVFWTFDRGDANVSDVLNALKTVFATIEQAAVLTAQEDGEEPEVWADEHGIEDLRTPAKHGPR